MARRYASAAGAYRVFASSTIPRRPDACPLFGCATAWARALKMASRTSGSTAATDAVGTGGTGPTQDQAKSAASADMAPTPSFIEPRSYPLLKFLTVYHA